MGRHLPGKQALNYMHSKKLFLILVFLFFLPFIYGQKLPQEESLTQEELPQEESLAQGELPQEESLAAQLLEEDLIAEEELEEELIAEEEPAGKPGAEEGLEEGRPPVIPRKALTLPLPENEEETEIERFRRQYLDPKWTKVLYDALENAIDYRLYVRKALADSELPPELEYLPIVESNYKTAAKSKSGALGLWQFMTNSVKPFLTLNDYVDERLDPWKETDAALKKLKENYDFFGDWLIAIAAYNCGAGAMSRAIAKLSKEDTKDFWTLCKKNLIPNQTQLYVPKLLAIADLCINCAHYGIELPLHEEEYEVLYNEKNAVFDYVKVNKAYSISALAQNLRIDSQELKRLNPSFTLGFTHPSQESSIRLPAGTSELALSVLENMEPMDFPIKYTVVQGDSLWSISRRYGCTVSQICELNGIKESAILKIGKILYIPSK